MSGKIFLRRLEEKDIPGMLEWMHDPQVNCWFRFDAAGMTEEKARCFIAGSFTDRDRHFAVTDETDEYLGTISLEDIDRENGHALYAVSMRTCAWGTDAAVKATNLLLDYAFGEIGLERVYLNVLSNNVRANRFYEKVGFRFEGCFRKHLKLRGGWADWNWYAILKEDYYGRNH
ncbi:MAG: GNAT family N-acetyltransferase [Anaerolineaceae bacterium]|nr:GNAT family N-acetyltransferase [Anaerolineaceae bacterium]